MQDLPRHHTVRESGHRIVNPFTPEKLKQLGDALFIERGSTMLDLACGKGEMLCTWARDYGVHGVGVDVSSIFIGAATLRAEELGVEDRVNFVHANANEYVADEDVDIASCIGATWIGGGVAGTVQLLDRSLKANGLMLIGHPYWRRMPKSDDIVGGCGAASINEWRDLAGQIEEFFEIGWDVVEMVLADQDSWDRYVAAQWFNIRRFLEEYPDDELAEDFRRELRTSPIDHVRYQREYLGWGVFAIKRAI